MTTTIEWTRGDDGSLGETWNPVTGCTKVSEGCRNCYAERLAPRLKQDFTDIILHPDRLDAPLHWRKPRRVFVNSMSDLFHEDIPDEYIDKVFAVMALCPQHTMQCLTKRPERMRAYCSDPETPFRVAKASDVIAVKLALAGLPEEIRPIDGYPGYFVTNYGRVLSSNGSATCLFCGGQVQGEASKAYCSTKCRQNAHYYRRTGKPRQGESTLAEMSPDIGEQGHSRVMLYVSGVPVRQLVHRLVLSTFVRSPHDGEQGCHRDGNPRNNALPNLRWGTQGNNWDDRKRHGNAHSYGVRRMVQPEIQWPWPNCWKGVSCEDQATADERIPLLLQTPAAIRFISAEPLLGPVSLERWLPIAARGERFERVKDIAAYGESRPRLNWIICGGESGPRARPMHPDWARSLRDQCVAAGVPFFFKQWGEWCPEDHLSDEELETRKGPIAHHAWPVGLPSWRCGKHAAGRLLDGREWNEFPPVPA